MSRRYIYAGVLSAILFIVCYIFLELGLIFSIPISCIAFGAFVLIYKERDIRKFNPALMSEYNYMASKLQHLGNLLETELEIKVKVTKVTDNAVKIMKLLEKRPDKVEQGYSFFDYYLPISIKILQQYIDSKKAGLIDAKEEQKKIELHFKKIEIAFDKQLENMHKSNMLDMQAEINVFERMLKLDGFVDKEVEENDDKQE